MRNRERPPWWRLVDWRVVAAVGLPVWAAAGVVVLGPASRAARVEGPPAPSPLAVAPAGPDEFVGPPKPPGEALPGGPLLWFHLTHIAAIPNRSPAVPAPDLLVAAAIEAQAGRAQRRDVAAAKPPPPETPARPAAPPAPKKAGPPVEINGCKTFDTFVAWRPSPAEAFKRAAKADKLVFVLHLAGNIEDDGFT